MVASQISRIAKFNRNLFDKAMKNYFGSKDVILHNLSETIDGQGNTITISDSTSVITGDLQYGTELDKTLVDAGLLKSGEGVFYCRYSYTINENDYVTVDTVNWRFNRQIRNPTLQGDVIHQEWAVERRESSD